MGSRLLIAGTHSGVGKTTITLGLIGALCRRGLRVQPFKCGPDYIDPTYHTRAAGRVCRNLDTWMMPAERLSAFFQQRTIDADIGLIEGVMGLFDGLDYDADTSSTAQVAKLLQAPVVLVMDVSAQARSAAAVALGFARFDEQLPLAGFILNRVGGESHGKGTARAIEKATGLPVFGWLPHIDNLQVAERHLGLIPTVEAGEWDALIETAADSVAKHLDIDRLIKLANSGQEVLVVAWSPDRATSRDRRSPERRAGYCAAAGVSDSGPEETFGRAKWDGQETIPQRAETIPQRAPQSPRAALPAGHGIKIAVARDEAFHFIYEENLELLREAGAHLEFFSPLRDAELPDGTQGIILSGGFPEVFAEQLAANKSLMRDIHRAYEQNLPIYAECGGLMYLTESITDLNHRTYPMVGLLPGRSVMTKNLTLGYRLARADGKNWLLREGEFLRGHEFHYSTWQGRPPELPAAYLLVPPNGDKDRSRPEGALLGNLHASYVHVHFWNLPEWGRRFVEACR